MVRCPNCGSRITENSSSCPYCGAVFGQETIRRSDNGQLTRKIAFDNNQDVRYAILNELRSAYIQRLILIILAACGLIMEALILISILVK